MLHTAAWMNLKIIMLNERNLYTQNYILYNSIYKNF